MAEVDRSEKLPATDPEKSPGQDVDIGAKVGTILNHADKNDADEALKVLQGHDGEVIVMTLEEEKKLLRKIDMYMMRKLHPPTIVLCVPYKVQTRTNVVT